MRGHMLEELTDVDGWQVSLCQCGWKSPPAPDYAIAAEMWADHAAVSGHWGRVPDLVAMTGSVARSCSDLDTTIACAEDTDPDLDHGDCDGTTVGTDWTCRPPRQVHGICSCTCHGAHGTTSQLEFNRV